jgi:serine/threonine-protein kinase
MMSQSISRRQFLTACAGGASLLLSNGTTQGAFGEDYYGAIAFSSSTGASGCSYGHAAREAAEEKAIKFCLDYGGGRDTNVVVWAKNAWFALARADRGAYGHAWAGSPAKAMDLARNYCGESATGKYVVWCEYTAPYASIGFDDEAIPDNMSNERGIIRKAMNILHSRFRNMLVASNTYSVLSGGAFVTTEALKAMGYDDSDNSRNLLLWNQLSHLRMANKDGKSYFPRVVFRVDHAESKYWAHAPLDRVTARSPDSVAGEFITTLNRYHLGARGDGSDPVAWAAVIAHEMLHNLGHRHEDDKYDDERQINVYQRAVYHNGKYKVGLACPRFY